MIRMDKFNDVLLSDFMDKFWGYGNVRANYWFVGMEEGGGGSFEEVDRRITQWNKRGRNTFEDLYEFHKAINVAKWFGKNAPLQSTWSQLIRVLFSAKGECAGKERVRFYQTEYLGRSNGDLCLLELMPLPSPNANQWLNDKYSDIPELASRQVYLLVIGKKRAQKITQLISEYKPEFVVFYGFKYLAWWRQITQTRLVPSILNGCDAYFGKLENTIYAVIHHPNSRQVSNEYFRSVGKEIVKIQLSEGQQVLPEVTMACESLMTPRTTAKLYSGTEPMSICKSLVESAQYLEEDGFTQKQLSSVHHKSLKGHEETFKATIKYFSDEPGLRERNHNYARRVIFIAEQYKLRGGSYSQLISEALSKWPLV